MSSHRSGIDPATQKVLAGIEDPELAARYPDRAHFISADHPRQGEMATRALFSGDPVVLVYPDGRELLVTPEHARGIAGLFLLAAALLLRLRRRKDGDGVQLPPRARIEARDSAGLPIAA
jgi:MYXO-CTERM domain-containing protein